MGREGERDEDLSRAREEMRKYEENEQMARIERLVEK